MKNFFGKLYAPLLLLPEQKLYWLTIYFDCGDKLSWSRFIALRQLETYVAEHHFPRRERICFERPRLKTPPGELRICLLPLD